MWDLGENMTYQNKKDNVIDFLKFGCILLKFSLWIKKKFKNEFFYAKYDKDNWF